jgi:hypothetical protein
VKAVIDPDHKQPPRSKPPRSEASSESESDDDLDSFENKIEAELNKDKDDVSKEDFREFGNRLKKIWKTDMMQELENSHEYGDADECVRSVIESYVGRSKRIKGKHGKVGEWCRRNPESLRKNIQAIVKMYKNRIDKENEKFNHT